MLNLDISQLEWLKSKLNFDSLADLLSLAKEKFPDTDIVPTLVLCGRTGAGKSSLINALMQRNVLPCGVIPTTQKATERELSEDGIPLRVIDLPGIGEAGLHDTRIKEMLDQADNAHVMLLALACPERSLDYETNFLREVDERYANREPLPRILAATKIDCASPVRDWNPQTLNLHEPRTQKECNIMDWLHYVEGVLGKSVQQIVPCASGASYSDVENQYGIQYLRKAIFEILPEAARTYFVRIAQDLSLIDARAESIVRIFSGMAAAAAAQPVPAIPDAALIMPIQITMLVRLTKLHGRELTADMAVKLLGPLMARVAGRFAFTQLSKMLPVAGSIVGSAVAGAMTYALGMGFHTLLHNGNWNFDPMTLADEVLKWWKKNDSH